MTILKWAAAFGLSFVCVVLLALVAAGLEHVNEAYLNHKAVWGILGLILVFWAFRIKARLWP